MPTDQHVLQPVKVSKLLGIPTSHDEPVTEKKRLEPVKVSEILKFYANTSSSSEEHTSRRTVVPKNRTKSVRRVFGGKSSSSLQSLDKCNAARLSIGKIVANKPQCKSRISCLPQPNSITQKHMQKIINGNIKNSATIKGVRESSAVGHLRDPFMKKTELKYSQCENRSETANQSTIPPIRILENITTDHEELGASTADKENIPPSLNREIQSSINDEVDLFKNDNSCLVDLWRGTITRIEKMEHNLNEVKVQQAVQIDLLQKIYHMMTIKYEPSKIPVSNTHISSKPQILRSPISLLNLMKADEKICISNKDKETQFDRVLHEHQKPAHLTAESSKVTNEAFSVMKKDFNSSITLSLQESPVTETPKRNKPHSCVKSDRPLQEYLVMKANMNILETPEPHGFKHNTDVNGSDMTFGSKDMRKSISSKLFDELKDLYLNSPEPTP